MASVRIRLYHKDYPAGQIFTDMDDYLAHLNGGWVDFPSKINDPLSVVIAPVVAPESIVGAKPEKPWVVPKIEAKKPGRPPKKVKRGKQQ